MRGVLNFFGAIGFLLIFPAAALAVGIPLILLARQLGAGDEFLYWLALPVAAVSVFASYQVGRRAHSLLAKVL